MSRNELLNRIVRFLDKFRDKSITQEEIDIVNNLKRERAMIVYHFLNSWEWPPEIPDPEPPRYIRNGRRLKLMRLIEKKYGRKMILFYHNVLSDWKGDMTKDEFREWWENRD